MADNFFGKLFVGDGEKPASSPPPVAAPPATAPQRPPQAAGMPARPASPPPQSIPQRPVAQGMPAGGAISSISDAATPTTNRQGPLLIRTPWRAMGAKSAHESC